MFNRGFSILNVLNKALTEKEQDTIVHSLTQYVAITLPPGGRQDSTDIVHCVPAALTRHSSLG